MAIPDLRSIFRDFVTDGVPASGRHNVVKSEMRRWGTYIEDAIVNGGVTGAGFLRAVNENAGGANAIIATTSVDPTSLDGGVLISLPITQANTGPVTVKFNDADPIPVLTNTGSPLSSGFLQPGMVVDGYIVDGAFRLRSDVATAQDRAASEAAAAEAGSHAREADAAASRALNASAYGYNGGRFLLGFENGIGINFIQNDAAIIGGPAPINSDRPQNVLTVTRASEADTINADLYLDTVAAGALAMTRYPNNGRSAGVFVGAEAHDLAYSPDDLTAINWTKSNVSVTPNAGIAPDGTNTAWQVQDTSDTIYGDLHNSQVIADLTSNGFITLSWFIKSVDAVLVQCRATLSGGTTLTAVVSVNLATRTISSATNSTAKLTELRDGWMRIDVTVQNNGTANTTVNHRLRIEASDLPSMRSVLYWKPKIYLGSRYLGIVDGRAGDVITLPLTDIDWNSQQGTLCVDIGNVPLAHARTILVQIDDGTENNRIALTLNQTGQLFGEFVRNGTPVNVAGVNALDGGRIALSWNGAKASLIYNGAIITEISNAPSVVGLTTLRIGSNIGGFGQPQVTFARIFFKAREMSLEEVVAAGTVNVTGGGGTASFSVAEIEAIDGVALAQSNAVRANGNPYLAKFRGGLNHVIQYGQSFSLGAFGHPPRSFTREYDALMVGGSVRPVSTSSPVFTPFGSAALNPLAITVESGGTILDGTAIADLDWENDGSSGETSSHAFSEMAKLLWNQWRSVDNDGDRQFVVTSTGRGGTTIEGLAKGTDHYARTVSAASIVAGLAGVSPVHAHMVLWEQGEANAPDGSGYKANMATLKADIEADIATAIYGQTRMPAFFFSQMGGFYANDGAEPTTVGQAQLEFALENTDSFLYAPNYRVTNKANGHLDANGYRWMGMMLAKCWYRVMVKGEGWLPLHITRAVQRGSEILLAYHVPAPPLQFADFFDGFTARNFATKGFLVVDEGGTVPITGVVIVGRATMLLSLGRDLVGAATVKYATKATFNGGGNVVDSDSLQSLYQYEYLPAAGDEAVANVAALVGKNYPLENPACAQIIQAEAI